MRYLTMSLVALVAACAGNNPPGPDLLAPEVQLTQIGIRNFGLSGGTLDTRVSIRNPNSAAIRSTGLTLSLDVQGHRFGTTESTHAFELAGDSTVTFVVPVDFKWSTVGVAARDLLKTGDVQYAISGRTMLLIAGKSWPFPFSKEGNVPLVGIP